jgi:hypothetical protein
MEGQPQQWKSEHSELLEHLMQHHKLIDNMARRPAAASMEARALPICSKTLLRFHSRKAEDSPCSAVMAKHLKSQWVEF